MRILFLHQNFPAQFIHLAPELARRGHEVAALTAASNSRASPVPVYRYKFEERRLADSALSIASHFTEHALRGEVVARVADVLRTRENFTPDVIFGHLGWGETLFVKAAWPHARLILYAEFFYSPRGLDADFDPEFQRPSTPRATRTMSRQAAQLLALHSADAAVAPTRWQADTYPAYLKHLLAVCHDGIDTDRVKPDHHASVELPGVPRPLHWGEEILTFVNRNLEPYRGYHTLMRAPGDPRAAPGRPRGDRGERFGELWRAGAAGLELEGDLP